MKPPQFTGKAAFQEHTRERKKGQRVGRRASRSRKRAVQGQVHSHTTPTTSALHSPSWQSLEMFLKEAGPEPASLAGEREHRAEASADTRHSEVGGDRVDKDGQELVIDNNG